MKLADYDNSFMARFLWVYIIFPMIGGALAGVFMRNNVSVEGGDSSDGNGN